MNLPIDDVVFTLMIFDSADLPSKSVCDNL